jgi:hemolysin III
MSEDITEKSAGEDSAEVSAEKNPPTPRTKLRGWFHAGFVPFDLAACIVLVCLAPGTIGKLSSAVFMVCSLILFSMSAVYNVFNWSPKVKAVLRRFDHMNIFLLIAGTYTPLAVTVLPLSFDVPWYKSGLDLLIIIWALALLGLLIHVIWITAPRWLYTGVYIVLGLAAVIWMPAIATSGAKYGVAIVALVASGGLLYIVGAVFYALKWPGRYAKVYGFHELFHTFTLVAVICHIVAIFLAVLPTWW